MMATLETASAAENVLLIQRMEKGKVMDRLYKGNQDHHKKSTFQHFQRYCS